MKLMNLSIYSFVFAAFVFVYGSNPQSVTSIGFHIIAGDTTSFVPNQQAGWSIYSSYLNQETADSIQFELLVRHNNDLDWNQEQLIGEISDSAYKPAVTQQVIYPLLSNSIWNVRIEPSGQCFVKLIQGSALPDDPAIFPINVRYKK